MNKTLGGAVFIRDNNTYDYHILETLDCLLDMCDEVVVLDAGSTDGTVIAIMEHLVKKNVGFNINKHEDGLWNVTSEGNNRVSICCMREKDWNEQHGKEKLAYFQNWALYFLKTDYVFLLQGDEIAHEDSFPFIRQAMEEGKESYLCERINLWGSVDHRLDVPQDRKPCSDVVLRLAKRGHVSYGDGESIECYPTSGEYIPFIKIWHYGFVRRRAIMPAKIKNMQANVFGVTPDSKLQGMELFDPFAWFSKEDLKPIEGKHPKYIQDWVNERRKEYQELW